MKALSILQPYAWLIVRPDITDLAERAQAYRVGQIKDIENRTWATSHRGPMLVHAGKRYPRRDHVEYAEWIAESYGITLPAYQDMPLGGILGVVNVTGCIREHPSPWKMFGTQGFVLADAQPLPFLPWPGKLGFFEVPDQFVKGLEVAV